ncbi:MAG TPA: porin [Steroidobacteraceae bacterium]|nr:porin [Steroidobacteraceae bacterium]
MLRPLVAALTAALVVFSYSGPSVAQNDQDAKMRVLQDRIEALSKELKSMKEEQDKTSKTVNSASKKLDTFMKGFFGTLDGSIDMTTKGMNGKQAYPYALAPGVTNPSGPFVQTGGPKAPPFGRVGWMPMMSSNGSNIGYRGSHQIGTSAVNFIYQVSSGFNLAASPGLRNSWTKSSNTVQGAIGFGDTYIGLSSHDWGQIKFGEMFTPYKTSTDRLNPFAGQLGNYNVMIANTGGDNRVEFGTRMDHVVSYSSPNFQGFSFDAAFAFGQNPDPNNNIMPLQSADCSGSNSPGSGNLFLACDDGGFNNAFSVDMKFEQGGLYLTAAYEIHTQVNRSSDGVGSNNPYYGYLVGLGNGVSPILDWADYNAFAAEYPGAAAAGSPEYSTAYDMGNEYAMKVGGQYKFQFGLTVSYLWEGMHRTVPAVMAFQNERTRNTDWLALSYDFANSADRIAIGWGHAGASAGDPGGQHNFEPGSVGNNEANMYTIAWWHKLDKQLTWYIDAADTVNDHNAHFDIGAGGHGIKTDCHDATHPLFIDYSSAGPTTWGGCHEIGVSTGLNFKF